MAPSASVGRASPPLPSRWAPGRKTPGARLPGEGTGPHKRRHALCRSVCRERRGVGRGQAVLAGCRSCPRGSHGLFHHLDGVGSPGKKHDGLGELAAAPDDVIRERLPAELAVGVCGVLAHREGGVEQKDSLPGPVAEVACRRLRASEVCHKLLVDVAQAGWELLVSVDREGESHRLPRPVVGVLPQDDDAHVAGGGPCQRVEDVLLGRVDDLLVAHPLHLMEQPFGRARDVLGRIAQPGVNVLVLVHGRWSVLFAGVVR